MRGLLWLLKICVWSLLGAIVLLMIFGPKEPVSPTKPFDRKLLKDGIDAFFSVSEARFADIKPGLQKRVVWRGLEEVPTDLALVYVHGFSGSSEDIRPVPDRLAEALDANLVYTRLTGHGREGDVLGKARASAWREDLQEALAVARAVGREVVIIAASTGASLVTAAAADDPEDMRNVKGVILMSPNYGISDPKAALLHLPGGRYWLPFLAGKRWSFEPQNARHARFWTTEYASTALFPMAAIARTAYRVDHGAITLPVLFYYSEEDTIVDGTRTTEVAGKWGGPVSRARPYLGAGVDPNAHMITGDTLSPTNTDTGTELMLAWIKAL